MSLAIAPRTDILLTVASGARVSLLDPQPATIHPRDIAAHLAKLNRFTGATEIFYSVAQHSRLVMDGVSEPAKPYALLHDAHEAYIGDLSTPLKAAMRRLADGADPVERLATAFDRAIHARFGLLWPAPRAIGMEVAQADARALATEVRDLMARDTGFPRRADPFAKSIRALSWERAEELFLKALGQTFPLLAL